MSTCSGRMRRSNSRCTSGDWVDVPSTTIAKRSLIFVALASACLRRPAARRLAPLAHGLAPRRKPARRSFSVSCQAHLAGDDALDARGRVHEQRALVIDRGRGPGERSASVDSDLDAAPKKRRSLDPLAMRGWQLGGIRQTIELAREA